LYPRAEHCLAVSTIRLLCLV